MLFNRDAKKHPHLSDFMDHAVRNKPHNPVAWPWPLFLLGFAAGGIAWAVVSILGHTAAEPEVFASALGMWWLGTGGYWVWRRSKVLEQNDLSAQDRLRLEAYEIVKRLHASKDKHRLHRDLSDPVSSLLEECARSWSRAMEALEGPFWTNVNLPLHWQSLRAQALLAVEQGMNEVLVILSAAVPEEPGKWRFDEVVEEVLGKKVFAGSSKDDHIPMTYEPARELAGKLKRLAAEVESATRDVAKDEAIAAQFSSGSALDLCVGELRQIQQAEDELRQGL